MNTAVSFHEFERASSSSSSIIFSPLRRFFGLLELSGIAKVGGGKGGNLFGDTADVREE